MPCSSPPQQVTIPLGKAPRQIERPKAPIGRVIAEGGTVRSGNLLLTAMTTPGHTPGALSWRWESCNSGVCRTMVYADSVTKRLDERLAKENAK